MVEEKVYFQDFFKIAGILSKPKTQADKIVVLVHGLGVDKEEGGFFTKLAGNLAEEGIASFRFDFRSRGESQGTWEDYTITGMLADLTYAIKFLKTKGYKEIGVVAASLGGSIAVLYCAYISVKFLCLLNPILTYKDLLQPETEWGGKWFRWSEMKRGYIEFEDTKLGMTFYKDLKEIDLLSNINKVKTPVLILHGDKDTYIPVSHSLKYYKLFGGKSDMVVIEGADHGFVGFENRVIPKILIFVKKYFPVVKAGGKYE